MKMTNREGILDIEAVNIFFSYINQGGLLMKIKTSIKSLFIMLVMALVLTSVTPVVLPQTHTAEAAKKKAKKTSKKGKKGKKGKAVNLRLNKTIAKVKVGKKVSIKVKGNKNKPVTWKISNGKVAKLTANGTKATITGVKDGIVAVTAKVGKSKVVCAVYVGKGTYADASGKTRKAFGNPIQLLAKYVAKQIGRAHV